MQLDPEERVLGVRTVVEPKAASRARITFPPLAFGAVLLVAWGLMDLTRFWIERESISEIAGSLTGGIARTRDIAARTQATVRDRVAATGGGLPLVVSGRPFLRETAWETWQSRRAYCGEGARLLVNLLLASGIDAARLYLANETGYFHVAVAYRDNDTWMLLPGVAAPAALEEWAGDSGRPLGEAVAIGPDVNGQPTWVARQAIFDRYSFANWTRFVGPEFEIHQTVPFPGWVVLIMENPPLLIGLAKIGGAFLIIFATAVFWRRI